MSINGVTAGNRIDWALSTYQVTIPEPEVNRRP